MNKRPRRDRWAATAALLVLTALRPLAAEDAPPPTEYQVKAAFLFNFAQFVEWPPEAFGSPDAPLALCILGEVPTSVDLQSVLAGKTISGRAIQIRRVSTGEGGAGCHVLFIGTPPDRSGPVFARPGLLTVGESPGFTHRGGIIRFLLEDGRVRFEINPDAAEGARLKISSKLLKLARIVR